MFIPPKKEEPPLDNNPCVTLIKEEHLLLSEGAFKKMVALVDPSHHGWSRGPGYLFACYNNVLGLGVRG